MFFWDIAKGSIIIPNPFLRVIHHHTFIHLHRLVQYEARRIPDTRLYPITVTRRCELIIPRPSINEGDYGVNVIYVCFLCDGRGDKTLIEEIKRGRNLFMDGFCVIIKDS